MSFSETDVEETRSKIYITVSNYLRDHRAARSSLLRSLMATCMRDNSLPARMHAAVFALMFDAGLDLEDLCGLKYDQWIWEPKSQQFVMQLGDRQKFAPSLSSLLVEDWRRHRGTLPGPLFYEDPNWPETSLTIAQLRHIFARRRAEAERLMSDQEYEVVARQIFSGIGKIQSQVTVGTKIRSDIIKPILDEKLHVKDDNESHETRGSQVEDTRSSTSLDKVEAKEKLDKLNKERARTFEDRAEKDGQIVEAFHRRLPMYSRKRLIMAFHLFGGLPQIRIAEMLLCSRQNVSQRIEEAKENLQTDKNFMIVSGRLRELAQKDKEAEKVE